MEDLCNFSKEDCKTPAISEFEGKKLVKACQTRWFSHAKAIEAAREEILSIWKTLEYFAKKEKDATTIGLLAITSKQFIIALYVTSNVLPVLNQFCLTFQCNDFGLAHYDSSLQLSVEFARSFKCLTDYL